MLNKKILYLYLNNKFNLLNNNFFFFMLLKKKINIYIKNNNKFFFNIKYFYNICIYQIIYSNFKKYDIYENNFQSLDTNIIVNFILSNEKKNINLYTKINDYSFYFYFLKKYFNYNI